MNTKPTEPENTTKIESLKLPDWEAVGRCGQYGYYEQDIVYTATPENITKLLEKLNEVIDYINEPPK